MLSAPVWYLNRRGWQLVRSRRPLPHRRDNAAPVYPTKPGVQPAAVSAKTVAVRPAPLKAAE